MILQFETELLQTEFWVPEVLYECYDLTGQNKDTEDYTDERIEEIILKVFDLQGERLGKNSELASDQTDGLQPRMRQCIRSVKQQFRKDEENEDKDDDKKDKDKDNKEKDKDKKDKDKNDKGKDDDEKDKGQDDKANNKGEKEKGKNNKGRNLAEKQNVRELVVTTKSVMGQEF